VVLDLSLPYAVPVRQPPQRRWATYTDANGRFRFDRLGNGTYRICVQAPGTVWLDPCEWDFAVPSIAVSTLVPAPAASIVLKKGAAVAVRIDDAGQLLARHEGKTPGAHLLIGVTTRARTLRLASTVSRDETGRTQQIVIPFDTPVRITVASSFFRLADGNGASLTGPGGTGNGISVTVPAAQRSATIRLALTGGN
jgi:hypothetical protein